MEYEKKINIFIDTNILEEQNKKLYEFKFSKTYDRLKKFIKYNDYTNFKIIIPKIVLDEICKHYVEEYESIENKLEYLDEKYANIKLEM